MHCFHAHLKDCKNNDNAAQIIEKSCSHVIVIILQEETCMFRYWRNQNNFLCKNLCILIKLNTFLFSISVFQSDLTPLCAMRANNIIYFCHNPNPKNISSSMNKSRSINRGFQTNWPLDRFSKRWSRNLIGRWGQVWGHLRSSLPSEGWILENLPWIDRKAKSNWTRFDFDQKCKILNFRQNILFVFQDHQVMYLNYSVHGYTVHEIDQK